MKILALVVVFLLSGCGSSSDFSISHYGVTIEGKMKDGSSISAEDAAARAEAAIYMSRK